ncbi:IclR family transcriptional regulator [Mycobacterium sp. 663a-19]|uniref:IclR family transcriptional regulator n=1 Tax=Mycobacterium sp. 663a-19 TaxID=2986148 RepID=UPI002D1F1838|nr:IclR family transcriptional regulator [Mycobacterium sp. 663a-19]MEB3980784.1 IclR family transcriptional regulator [Mycobacterium sp. 663a-19]
MTVDTEEMCSAERHTAPASATSVIRRMAQIFDALDSAGIPLGIRELARHTHLPPSTVARLVNDMAEAGFIDRHARKVGVGLRVFEWGERARDLQWARQVAMPLLTDLRAATHQTIHLAILDGVDVMYLEILPSLTAPRLPSRVGGRLPAHATAVGKALLAASPPHIIDMLVATGLPALGPRTIRQPGLLRQQLTRAATSELAFEQEESGPGIVCVATAIRDANGLPVGAISAAGWAGKMNLRQVAPAVQATARNIGRRVLATSPGHAVRRDEQ